MKNSNELTKQAISAGVDLFDEKTVSSVDRENGEMIIYAKGNNDHVE